MVQKPCSQDKHDSKLTCLAPTFVQIQVAGVQTFLRHRVEIRVPAMQRHRMALLCKVLEIQAGFKTNSKFQLKPRLPHAHERQHNLAHIMSGLVERTTRSLWRQLVLLVHEATFVVHHQHAFRPKKAWTCRSSDLPSASNQKQSFWPCRCPHLALQSIAQQPRDALQSQACLSTDIVLNFVQDTKQRLCASARLRARARLIFHNEERGTETARSTQLSSLHPPEILPNSLFIHHASSVGLAQML